MAGVLVPIVFFAFLTAIIIGPRYMRYRNREQLLATLRAAYERGTPVSPELMEILQSEREPLQPDRMMRSRSPDRDLRRGVVLIAVAVALLVLGVSLQFSEEYEGAGPMVGLAAFPGFIGLGFLALWFFGRGQNKL